MAKDHGPSVKDDELYETLREEGDSKEKAARIANAKAGARTSAARAARPRTTRSEAWRSCATGRPSSTSRAARRSASQSWSTRSATTEVASRLKRRHPGGLIRLRGASGIAGGLVRRGGGASAGWRPQWLRSASISSDLLISERPSMSSSAARSRNSSTLRSS